MTIDSNVTDTDDNSCSTAAAASRQASNIASSLQERQVSIDGCLAVSKSDRELLLSGHICDILKLNGAGLPALELCIDVDENRFEALLRKSDKLITHFSLCAMYARSAVESSDLMSVSGQECLNNCAQHVYNIRGTRHNIYIIVYHHKLCASFVFDTIISGQQTAFVSCPSYLPWDKHRQLEVAAYQCCNEIGLASGVFTVEMCMTSTGPKLLSVIPCLHDIYVRNWIQTIYSVDIYLAMFLIACNIEPKFFSPVHNVKPTVQIVGVVIPLLEHFRILSEPSNAKLLRLLSDNKVLHVLHGADENDFNR